MLYELNGKPASKLFFNSLKKVRDLEWFDGPLTTEFKSKNNSISYIYHWCDVDDKFNRWLVSQVWEDDVDLYMDRIISYRELFESSYLNRYYVLDIDTDRNIVSATIISSENCPTEYLPGNYLHAAEYIDYYEDRSTEI
jgi:hypothetical protein